MGAIAKLFAEIGADTSKLDSSLKKSEKQLGGFAKSLGSIAPLLGVTFGAATVGMIVRTGMEMGRLGAQSMRLKTAFEQQAAAHNGNAAAMLASLKTASQGAIAETDIILSANRAMLLGLGANADELGQLMQVAAFRAQAMGLSYTQAFDNIVTGIGRKSPLILDNLGIVGLKMDQNTTTAEIMAQVITSGMKEIAAAGGVAADAMTKFERMEAKTADMKTKLAELWVETGVPELAIDFVTEGVDGWMNTFDALDAIGKWAADNHSTTIDVLIMGPEGAINSARDFQSIFTADEGAFYEADEKSMEMQGVVITQWGELYDAAQNYDAAAQRALDASRWEGLAKQSSNQLEMLATDYEDTTEAAERLSLAAYRSQGLEIMAQRMIAAGQAAEYMASAVDHALSKSARIQSSASLRSGVGDSYSNASGFGADQGALLTAVRAAQDQHYLDAMIQANKGAADDFNAKMKGANSIISGDIADKVHQALGLGDGPRTGDAPAEPARRLADIAARGESSPWAEAMRGQLASAFDTMRPGSGIGANILGDEGQMRAYAAELGEMFNDPALGAGLMRGLEAATGDEWINELALAHEMGALRGIERLAESGFEQLQLAGITMGNTLATGLGTGLVTENGEPPLQPLNTDLDLALTKITDFKDLWDNLDDKTLTLFIEMAGSDGFATGGIVGGMKGNPVSILAHAGEMILNPAQQAQASNMMRGGSGVSIHVHAGVFMGSEAEAQQFARKAAPYIKRAMR